MSDGISEAAEFTRLLETIRELRQQCPWDREQTLRDTAKHLIEEAYEAADAIDRGDSRAIADELGDVLVQVLFASVIAEQEGRERLDNLVQAAAAKLVRRHPHVYAGAQAVSPSEVVANWDRIKRAERESEGLASALDGVAQNLPALMRAEKLGARARQAGMDWTDIHDVLAKVREEMDEVEGALAQDDTTAAAGELGDMLLALANAPRFIGHSAEEVLRRSCNKFRERFEMVERIAAKRGISLTSLRAAELEALWQEAKRELGK